MVLTAYPFTIRILRRTEADPPKSRRFWGKPLVDYSDETPRAALRRHRRRLATVDKQLAKLAVEIAKLQAAARSSEQAVRSRFKFCSALCHSRAAVANSTAASVPKSGSSADVASA